MKKVSFFSFICLLLLCACSKENPINISQPVDQENLGADGLPIKTFEVSVPVIPKTKEYTIDVTQWDIPTNYTEPLKTTANLQAAIDWAHDEGYTQVVLPQGEYLVGKEGNDIYQAGIDIYDNTEFIFNEGAVLGIDTNDKWNYCVLRLNCLLYTSPSPRDKRQSRMPSSA